MPRDPNKPNWGFQPTDPKVRFMRLVTKDETGCWIWRGTIPKNGYGRFGISPDRSTWAHRAAWILFRGPIPDGTELDHLCRVRRCVNPDHLEPVTHTENVHRAEDARFGIYCRSGRHDLTEINAIRRGTRRSCRRCFNENWLRGHKRRKEARLRAEGAAA